MPEIEDPGLQAIQRNPDGTWPKGVSGNIAGKPKGSHSIRSALKRRLRKDWEDDKDAPTADEALGTWARQLADDIATAIEEGDADKVRSIATIIDQAEGKPQERVEHSGQMKQVIIEIEGRPENPEPL